MTTISEFVQGEALEKTIISSCSSYRKAFTKMIEKAGVGENDIEDVEARMKINKTSSWSWMGFLFSVFWAIYRKQKIGWFCLMVVLVITFPPLYENVPIIDTAGNFLGLALGIVFGMQGKKLLLITALIVNSETSSPVGRWYTTSDRQLRSLVDLAIAIVTCIVYFWGIDAFL